MAAFLVLLLQNERISRKQKKKKKKKKKKIFARSLFRFFLLALPLPFEQPSTTTIDVTLSDGAPSYGPGHEYFGDVCRLLHCWFCPPPSGARHRVTQDSDTPRGNRYEESHDDDETASQNVHVGRVGKNK